MCTPPTWFALMLKCCTAGILGGACEAMGTVMAGCMGRDRLVGGGLMLKACWYVGTAGLLMYMGCWGAGLAGRVAYTWWYWCWVGATWCCGLWWWDAGWGSVAYAGPLGLEGPSIRMMEDMAPSATSVSWVTLQESKSHHCGAIMSAKAVLSDSLMFFTYMVIK